MISLLFSSITLSVFFSTASDSPVNTASLTIKLCASISLTSAGTNLPASIITTSPGTNSSDSSSTSSPPLITIVLMLLILLSASSDFLAFTSCIVATTEFNITISNIIIASLVSLIRNATTTTTNKIIDNGSINCLRNISNVVFCFFSFNLFLPYFSILFFTSSCVNPS